MNETKTIQILGYEWCKPVPTAVLVPFVTHSGVLKIGEHSLRCFRLSNGEALFDAEDFEKFFSEMAG